MASNEQLLVIKKALEQLGITFLDIQTPIANSIEKKVKNLMLTEGMSFEIALKKELHGLEPFFIYSRSFYLGLFYNFPLIILKKLEGMERKLLFNLLKIILLAVIFFYFFKNLVYEILAVGSSAVIAVLVVSVLLFGIVARTKTKTSYRFFINKTLLMLIFFSLLFFMTSAILSKGIMLLFVFYYFYVILENYQKHTLFCKTFT